MKTCRVCVHPERKTVETLLLYGRSARSLGRAWTELGRNAIRGHLVGCRFLEDERREDRAQEE